MPNITPDEAKAETRPGRVGPHKFGWFEEQVAQTIPSLYGCMRLTPSLSHRGARRNSDGMKTRKPIGHRFAFHRDAWRCSVILGNSQAGSVFRHRAADETGKYR